MEKLSGLSNFELLFEIVILSNNIANLKKLGYLTQDLETRLEKCFVERDSRKSFNATKNHGMTNIQSE